MRRLKDDCFNLLSVGEVPNLESQVELTVSRARLYQYLGSHSPCPVLHPLHLVPSATPRKITNCPQMRTTAVNIVSRALTSIHYTSITFFRRHNALLVADKDVCLISVFEFEF